MYSEKPPHSVPGLAVPVFADAAPFAVVTADVVLDEDAVSFGNAVQPLELLPRHRNGADVLVAHDHRVVEGWLGVHLHVRATDSGDLDLEQGGVVGQLGHRELSDFCGAGCDPHRGENTVGHLSPSSASMALWSCQYTKPWSQRLVTESDECLSLC
jgi:hypothetical protein